MVKKEPFIFQIDSPAVLEAFDTNNYCIEYTTGDNCNSNLCAIYFSSNDIYYPNTLKSFDYSITGRDKYEWKRNKLPNASKHIFIRDIRKQWYIGGINSKINTASKLAEFLKNETAGFTTYTIGSSAGGFAAILFGSLLKVNRVYAFNAQLNLGVTMQNSNALVDPILFDKIKDDELKHYFDLSNFISESVNYYYFLSLYSKMDTDQYESIGLQAKQYLKIIRFKTSHHGIPFLKINLPNILAFNHDNLENLVNKSFHPIVFSIRLIGIKSTFLFLTRAIIDRWHKKRIESNFKE